MLSWLHERTLRIFSTQSIASYILRAEKNKARKWYEKRGKKHFKKPQKYGKLIPGHERVEKENKRNRRNID